MQPLEVLKVLEAVFVSIGLGYSRRRAEIHQGEGEDTLILQLSGDDFDFDAVEIAIYQIALKLKQECIAYRLRDNNGGVISENLIGPYASAWGDFNSDYFYE
jgi:hypothetical protein